MILYQIFIKNIFFFGLPSNLERIPIFAFNGSSSEYMIHMFVEDFHPTVIELKENYRSSKKVLQAAEKIIPDSSDIVNVVIEGIFEIHKMDDEESEAQWIIEKIAELIKLGKHDYIEGDITYEKIAILGRNKYIFKHLTDLFVEKGVPYYYKISPGSIKFESKLMKIFDMAFRVRLNQQDTLHWYKLLELCNMPEAKNLKDQQEGQCHGVIKNGPFQGFWKFFMNKITESNIETFAIEVFKSQGWYYIHGLSIAPGAEYAERGSFEQIILTQRLRKAVSQVNERESEGKVFGVMTFMLYLYNMTNKQEVQNACS